MIISKLFEEMGFPYETLEYDSPIDVSHLKYEIYAFDLKAKKNVWSKILKIVRKESTIGYSVNIENRTTLTVSGLHRFYVKTNDIEHWLPAMEAVDRNDLYILDDSNNWVNCKVSKTNSITDILDIEVENTNCYYSNGILSHNTMFGDPTCVDPYTTKITIKYEENSKIAKLLQNVKEAK